MVGFVETYVFLINHQGIEKRVSHRGIPFFAPICHFFHLSTYHIRLAPSQVPFVPFHLFGEKVTHSTAPSLPAKITFLREP